MIDLTCRHIFVVGGSRGIGAAAARMAAKAGADVSISYRERDDAAANVIWDVIAEGPRGFAVKAEVSEDGAMDRAVDEAVEELGPLRGMVISAEIYEAASLPEMTSEFWDRTLSINLRGTFLSARAAARQIRASGQGGSIVIFTSTAGQSGSAGHSAYAASKGGQIVFMKSLAQELASDRIRVNCLAPAWTDTDMATAEIEAIGREKVIRGFPLGRIGLPEDVAGATCFLLSDLAEFITGVTLTVDGGMAMRG